MGIDLFKLSTGTRPVCNIKWGTLTTVYAAPCRNKKAKM